MLDSEKFDHLAELSKLEFNDTQKKRMLNELGLAIKRANKVFQNEGLLLNPQGISVEKLRADRVQPSLEAKEALKNTKTKNNCFVTNKVV